MSDILAVNALKEKQRSESEYLKQESRQMKLSMKTKNELSSDVFLLKNRRYSFSNRNKSKIADRFSTNTDMLERSSLPAASEDILQQGAEAMTKSEKKVVKNEKQLIAAQKRVLEEREGEGDEKSAAVAEEKLLEAKIKLIKAQAENDLENTSDTVERYEIRIRRQESIIEARKAFAYTLPIGSKRRRIALAKKEEDEIKLFRYKWKKKIAQMPSGNEKDHEEEQYFHKYVESLSQSVLSKSDPNCREDAVLKVEIGGKPLVLVNTGRAFMGGSKPCYYFTDKTTGKRYLYKKAENCCGFSNPKGAIMTEIGGKLQALLDPKHAIPAVGIKNEKGKYIGSLQEIIEVKKDGFDFNSWQHQPEEERSTDVLTNEVKEQILTFHAIDWILCNYDTKGENLLQRSDGSFVSIDKEGAMSHVLKDGTFDMSVDYSPHTDEPIYNTFFRMYREGRIDLDMKIVEAVIAKVEILDDEEYEKMFEPYIKTLDEDEKIPVKNEIMRRKQNIRQAYDKFFKELNSHRT